MSARHPGLAAGGWGRLSLSEQLGNVGSEVGRAVRWKEKNPRLFEEAMLRALELLDLSIQDSRWIHRLKELARVREFLCAAWLGSPEYKTTLEDLDRYFLNFAVLARKSR